MSRTPGSGWGGGVMLWQLCPFCDKKKATFKPLDQLPPFRCSNCKERFYSDTLIRETISRANASDKIFRKDRHLTERTIE